MAYMSLFMEAMEEAEEADAEEEAAADRGRQAPAAAAEDADDVVRPAGRGRRAEVLQSDSDREAEPDADPGPVSRLARKRAADGDPEGDMAIKRMQVSVTVSRLGGDLPFDKWQRAARAIMNHPGVHKTAIAYERGTEQENGHMQAVMEVDASSTAAVHKWVRTKFADEQGIHVRVVTLSQERMHTFSGMVGYVLKRAADGDPEGDMAIKRMQVSVTVSRLGGDLPFDKWQRAARAITNHPGVHKTAIAYERGTEQENGHMQAVMEVDASSTAAVHNKLEAAWKVALEPKTVTPNDMETIFFAKPTFDARYFNMDFSDKYKELEDHIEKQNPLERLLPYFPPESQLTQQLRQGTASRQDRQEFFHPIFGALGCTEEELLAAQADIENGPPVEEADIETGVRLHAEAGYIPALPASLRARHKFMSNLTLQIPCGFCGGTIKFLLPQFDDVVHKRKMFCQECDDKRTAAHNTRREADAAATASGALAPALQPSFLPADAVAALAACRDVIGSVT
ncbi:hypothetical protein GPECTOR_534g536 [Gonium pectorale]|uniref:Replitron HUH endonuclease domain-containing protein n=1 Tax=Gonium pectorale TaxID=33097 RepID=A0A150FUS1_GONPE|nr:hypothetical protein GPECTOR_534g536 [Gonium pectorale]|eukprot:KXZ41339.1 hypothetical protein GPECTOR_534g536 [Gonium pectorale]